MAMLTHTDGRFKPDSYPSERRHIASATPVAPATIRRICLRALAVLLEGGALTAVIALKTAAYFWRFPH